MKLDVYKAIEVVAILDGGSTQPIIMRVVDSKNNYQNDYVVKVFKVNNIAQSQSTHKEFYVNALATEFNLPVPKAALIQVDNDIIAKLKEKEAFKGFELQEGHYYGSEYLNNSFVYDVNHLKNFEQWELETIFAFDALIRNVDRRRLKPNILIHKQQFYLIDHELTFEIPNDRDCTYYIDSSKWAFLIDEKTRTHIFYPYLKNINQVEPLQFDLFREYLNTLNLTELTEVANQLDEVLPKSTAEDIEYGEENEIIENIATIVAYLRCIKQHENQFINLLKQLLA